MVGGKGEFFMGNDEGVFVAVGLVLPVGTVNIVTESAYPWLSYLPRKSKFTTSISVR